MLSPRIKGKAKDTKKVCEEKGWDINNLTTSQVIEIAKESDVYIEWYEK